MRNPFSSINVAVNVKNCSLKGTYDIFIAGAFSAEFNFLQPYKYQGYFGGGGHPILVDVSQNFWKLVDVFFFKNGDFFEIFEMYLPTTPQKSLFIAFLLTNFPKISKKVLKNFSRRLRRRKCGEIPQFFRPECGKFTPPPLRGHPPKKISLIIIVSQFPVGINP